MINLSRFNRGQLLPALCLSTFYLGLAQAGQSIIETLPLPKGTISIPLGCDPASDDRTQMFVRANPQEAQLLRNLVILGDDSDTNHTGCDGNFGGIIGSTNWKPIVTDEKGNLITVLPDLEPGYETLIAYGANRDLTKIVGYASKIQKGSIIDTKPFYWDGITKKMIELPLPQSAFSNYSAMPFSVSDAPDGSVVIDGELTRVFYGANRAKLGAYAQLRLLAHLGHCHKMTDAQILDEAKTFLTGDESKVKGYTKLLAVRWVKSSGADTFTAQTIIPKGAIATSYSDTSDDGRTVLLRGASQWNTYLGYTLIFNSLKAFNNTNTHSSFPIEDGYLNNNGTRAVIAKDDSGQTRLTTYYSTTYKVDETGVSTNDAFADTPKLQDYYARYGNKDIPVRYSGYSYTSSTPIGPSYFFYKNWKDMVPGLKFIQQEECDIQNWEPFNPDTAHFFYQAESSDPDRYVTLYGYYQLAVDRTQVQSSDSDSRQISYDQNSTPNKSPDMFFKLTLHFSDCYRLYK